MDGWLICILYMFYMIRIVNQNNWYISLPSIIEQNTNDALSLSLLILTTVLNLAKRQTYPSYKIRALSTGYRFSPIVMPPSQSLFILSEKLVCNQESRTFIEHVKKTEPNQNSEPFAF